MLEITLLEEDKIAVLRPTPPLTSEDFKQVARALDPEIERLGRLNGVMVVAPNFPHWDDFPALISHLRFVRDHHRQIAHVALVSDSPALKTIPALARLFVKAQLRHFNSGAEDNAREWLVSPPTSEDGLKLHRSENPPVLWIEIDGKITTERYQELRKELESLLGAQNDGAILVRLKHFQGIDPAALLEDLKLGLQHLKPFKRVAIVSDAQWLDRAARVASAFMPGEIRTFAETSEEEAWDWVKTDSSATPS